MPSSWSRWLWCWGLVSLVGVCTALLSGAVPSVLAVAGTVGAFTAAGIAANRWPEGFGDRTAVRTTWHITASLSVFAASASVALVTAAEVAPPLFGFLIVVAALTSPPVLRTVHRFTGSTRSPSAGPSLEQLGEAGPPSTPRSVREVDARRLCIAWRRSYELLQDASSPSDISRVVQLRQVYLDEMERRDAPAFHAWLDSGARAAGGPERFLAQGSAPDDQTGGE